MSIFDRTSYLRALFVLLPFGIVFLFFGIRGLAERETDLVQYNGVINNVYLGIRYNENIDEYMEAIHIEIVDNESIFRTYIAKHIERLKHSINKGDTVTLWTRSQNYRIVKLQRGEELLIPFNSTTWMDLFILLIGIVFTLLSVVYIIKHPEDLWGGDKEKMKRWWNGELW